MDFRRWQGRVVAAALLVLTAACTTVEVTPLTTAPPPTQTYKNVVLGTVDAKDPYQAYAIDFFREGFVRRLRELKGFETVTDSAVPSSTATASAGTAPATSPAADTLLVTATLTNVDKGDAVLRFFVGMGAGRERAAAAVTMRSNDGAVIGSFEVQKAYSGGAGIGGLSALDIEDLVKQVGEQAAQSLLDWSQGKLTKDNSQGSAH